MVWIVLSILVSILLIGVLLVLLICSKFDRMFDELEQINKLDDKENDDEKI